MNSNNNITNPKCSKCKCYFIPTIKSSGLPYTTCDKCRTKDKESRVKNKCPHDKQKQICKDCNGSSFCEHGKRKSTCRECKGVSICIHDKIKSRCIQCGGISICEHNKQKLQCKACGGSQICEHNKQKSQCKACCGSQICEHNKQKKNCKECNPKLYLIRLHTNQIKRYLTSSRYEKIKNHYNDNLGCTVDEFINHIKKKIEYFNTYLSTSEPMTLENITIDHIKPVSKFKLDDENDFLDCCHYTNLQPLLHITNKEKYNTWTDENNKYWNENIKNKEYHEIYIP